MYLGSVQREVQSWFRAFDSWREGWEASVARLGPGQLGEFSVSDGRDITSGTMGSDEEGRMEISLGTKQGRTGKMERLIISKLLVTSRVG